MGGNERVAHFICIGFETRNEAKIGNKKFIGELVSQKEKPKYAAMWVTPFRNPRIDGFDGIVR
jgi:hypothetical protein